jgi:hypothetical protein
MGSSSNRAERIDALTPQMIVSSRLLRATVVPLASARLDVHGYVLGRAPAIIVVNGTDEVITNVEIDVSTEPGHSWVWGHQDLRLPYMR